jgi:hypothetical protein
VKLPWRWLAMALILVNLALAGLFLFGRAPAPPEREIPPLDPSLPWLELVTELGGGNSGPGGELCYTIGPLSSELALQRAEDRLRPFANSIRSRQTQADSDRGWWVYLPANSRAEAVSLSRELAGRGVEDFYVVTSGPLENTVSVGLFQSMDNARNRQARIRELGFDVRIEVRRETIDQFWVDYRIDPDERSPWRFIVRSSPGSQHREIPCWDD